MLIHKNPICRDNQVREHGPHRNQEQVEILKELATMIAARTTRGRPGRASVAVQQWMTQCGLYSDFKMTPQEVNRFANLPEWMTVLEVMIKSRQTDLAFQMTKQEQWNQRAQDWQAHQDFLEEHWVTGKFSGKYTLQPQQTELIILSGATVTQRSTEVSSVRWSHAMATYKPNHLDAVTLCWATQRHSTGISVSMASSGWIAEWSGLCKSSWATLKCTNGLAKQCRRKSSKRN